VKRGEGFALLALVLLVGAGARKKVFAKADLVALARRVGFRDPELAAAVALAESGGNALAVGDFGRSFGLWQIHTPAHPEYSGQSLFDPDYNARAALAISKQGADWSPWTTYKNGTYKRYLPVGRAA
jgi:soluble lytic murein transglycosylase-like protein